MAQDKIYLTVDNNPKGAGLLAVMTRGCVPYDKEVIVLTLEVVSNMKAAKKWYNKMLIERPWETRN